MASIYMGTGAIHGGVRCPLSAGAPQSTCFYGRNGTVKGSRCIDAKATTVKSAPPAEIAEEHRTSSAAIKSAYSKIDFEQVDNNVQSMPCLPSSALESRWRIWEACLLL